MPTPYLQYDDIIASAINGGYSEKPRLSQKGSVFLLALCVVSRLRWIWQNPVNPISDATWEDIKDLIRSTEAELMSTYAIGSIIVSVVDLDAQLSLLRLNGQTVTQADYPLLTAVCPASWLSGSDIVLPDMDDVSIHGNYSSPGGFLGANTHQLTIAELPTHTHIQNGHQHTYNAPIVTPTAGGEIPATADLVVPTPTLTSSDVATNQNTGGDGSHNNIPESMEVIYYLVSR